MADVTISITIPEAKVQRVQDAVTYAQRLDSPATIADVKGVLLDKLRGYVLSAESRQAEDARVVVPLDMS
jgi:hypothetical protein